MFTLCRCVVMSLQVGIKYISTYIHSYTLIYICKSDVQVIELQRMNALHCDNEATYKTNIYLLYTLCPWRSQSVGESTTRKMEKSFSPFLSLILSSSSPLSTYVYTCLYVLDEVKKRRRNVSRSVSFKPYRWLSFIDHLTELFYWFIYSDIIYLFYLFEINRLTNEYIPEINFNGFFVLYIYKIVLGRLTGPEYTVHKTHSHNL